VRSSETYRWEGRPATGILFRGSDIILVPFSLAWAVPVFSSVLPGILFAHPVTTSSSGSLAVLPILIIFPIVGFYITVGRFAIDIWRRNCLRYALTDREAIIRGTFPWAQERRIDLGRLPEVVLRRGRNGRGTIQFGTTGWMGNANTGAFGFGPQVPSFESIPNVESVYNMIRESQQR
jgi:hypothetical protein